MLLVTGSLAFDRISVFSGRFSNHILPDKINRLNVAFAVKKMTINFGGTGGNIAYNLSLLGEKPILLSTAGNDFSAYRIKLAGNGVDLKYIKTVSHTLTAQATIITDIDDNQITAFYKGAMGYAHEAKISDVKEGIDVAIIAPNGLHAMVDYANYCRENNIPFIADPGQAIPALSNDNLNALITGAQVLVVNDYEWDLIHKQTGLSYKEILEKVMYLIVTYGERGSRIYSQDSKVINIPPYPKEKVVDPTGCGDAFRAGLMYGKKHYSIEKAAHIGSWLAAKVAEKEGTQNHVVDKEEFQKFLETV